MVSCVCSSAVSNNWIPNFIEGVNEFLSNSSVNEFLPNSRFLNCHSKNGVNEFLPNSRYSSCRSKNENKKKNATKGRVSPMPDLAHARCL